MRQCEFTSIIIFMFVYFDDNERTIIWNKLHGLVYNYRKQSNENKMYIGHL